MFEIGDAVKIIDKDEIYGSYNQWVKKNAPAYYDRWSRSIHKCDDINAEFIVVANAEHGSNLHAVSASTMLYLVLNKEDQCFILDDNGLVYANKKRLKSLSEPVEEEYDRFEGIL